MAATEVRGLFALFWRDGIHLPFRPVWDSAWINAINITIPEILDTGNWQSNHTYLFMNALLKDIKHKSATQQSPNSSTYAGYPKEICYKFLHFLLRWVRTLLSLFHCWR
jgi:hypothetical protein